MITFELNQSRLRGGQRLPLDLVEKVIRLVAKTLRKKGPYHVSMAFLSETEMRRANAQYRGKDRVTDVLSFALTSETGELLFCYPQARRQAEDMGHSVRHELCFLLVHGLLHLFGYDHERPTDAKKMFPLQTSILKKLHVNPRLSYD